MHSHRKTGLPGGRLAAGLPVWAEEIGVSLGFLRLEISRGKLQVTRLGRRVLVTKREIDRYLAENSQDAR
jgi:excisionase family DNA binding protein